jgi:hypothetical protein
MPYIYMTKLQIFYVWVICRTTDISKVLQYVPNTPVHALANIRSSCCDACFR